MKKKLKKLLFLPAIILTVWKTFQYRDGDPESSLALGVTIALISMIVLSNVEWRKYFFCQRSILLVGGGLITFLALEGGSIHPDYFGCGLIIFLFIGGFLDQFLFQSTT